VGFEPTIPVFERVKMVHASDRAAAVNDTYMPRRDLEETEAVNYCGARRPAAI
jgi:hypothetical protein